MVDFAKLREKAKQNIKLDDPRWETVPMGEHNAICVDAFMAEAEKYNKKDDSVFKSKVIYLVWLVYPVGDDGKLILDQTGKVFLIDKQFNAKIDPKNEYSLYPILKDWGGRELSAAEIESYDVSSLIGKPCTLIVETRERQNGKGMYSIVLTAEPCKTQDKFWEIPESQYKRRDYTQDLKAYIPKKAGQAQAESAWEPAPGSLKSTDDEIPF